MGHVILWLRKVEGMSLLIVFKCTKGCCPYVFWRVGKLLRLKPTLIFNTESRGSSSFIHLYDLIMHEASRSFLSAYLANNVIVSQRLVKSRSEMKIWTLSVSPSIRVLSDSSCLQDCQQWAALLVSFPVPHPCTTSKWKGYSYAFPLPFAKQAVRRGPFIPSINAQCQLIRIKIIYKNWSLLISIDKYFGSNPKIEPKGVMISQAKIKGNKRIG